MKIATSIVKTVVTPNKHSELPNLLISTNVSVLYVHLNHEPDIGYEENADVIIGWFQAIVPKILLSTGELSFYQSTGSDGYVSISEAL